MPTLLLDGTLTAVSPIAIILPGSEDGRTPPGAPRKRMLRDGPADLAERHDDHLAEAYGSTTCE